MALLKGHNVILLSYISETYIATSFKLDQLMRIMSELSGKIKKKYIGAIALCKFGHRKLDISKTSTARSFKYRQLIENHK